MNRRSGGSEDRRIRGSGDPRIWGSGGYEGARMIRRVEDPRIGAPADVTSAKPSRSQGANLSPRESTHIPRARAFKLNEECTFPGRQPFTLTKHSHPQGANLFIPTKHPHPQGASVSPRRSTHILGALAFHPDARLTFSGRAPFTSTKTSHFQGAGLLPRRSSHIPRVQTFFTSAKHFHSQGASLSPRRDTHILRARASYLDGAPHTLGAPALHLDETLARPGRKRFTSTKHPHPQGASVSPRLRMRKNSAKLLC